jgi:anti-sigma B factor antagonist
VAVNDTSFIDRNGVGRFRIGGLVRSADKKAAGVWPAGQRAEQSVRFSSDQPAPGVRVVRVVGELDSLTAPLLDHYLQTPLQGPGRHVVLDLSEVTLLSAAGLTSLITARDTATRGGIELHLTGADHRAIARPLEILELRATFDVHPTVHSIVDAISSNSAVIGLGLPMAREA